eukprot:NODE_2699_length_2163_cov_14.545187.p1 GENE.NODE_2699_length_2163_cov_14.545187~~NODE_2699_length_2163_cov_14.545187.p1  ORF type:complete len:592 (+),score=118.73 NODE_2699_length_2163_cov_14.545187:165-1940(+)
MIDPASDAQGQSNGADAGTDTAGDLGFTNDGSEWGPAREVVLSSTASSFMCHPSSAVRIAWEAISMLTIAHDILTMPLMAFGYDKIDPPGTIMRYFTSIFWTCDFCFSFWVGHYLIDGRLEMRPSIVARNYLRTWLVPDLCIVAADWTLMFFHVSAKIASVARLSKTVRMVRIIRMLRLARIGKLHHFLDAFGDTKNAQNLTAILGILKLLTMLALVCHFVGCSWYAIGTIGYDGHLEETWVASLEDDDASMFFRYLNSFHWAFAQFTPSSSPYHPRNLREELFNIFLLFFGFVVFSSFVGSVTSTLTMLRDRSTLEAKQQKLFRQFITSNNVSWQLGHKISTFRTHRRRKTAERVLERDVLYLSNMPESLAVELHCEVFAPILTAHPLFLHCLRWWPEFFREVCHCCASQRLLKLREEVFFDGNEATMVVFVICGTFYYVALTQPQHVSNSLDLEQNHLEDGVQLPIPPSFSSGEWLCEAALWMTYKHGGTLTAQGDSDVVLVDALKFHKVASRHPAARHRLQVYAHEFDRCSASITALNLDLFGSRIQVEDVLDGTFSDDKTALECDECPFTDIGGPAVPNESGGGYST